MIPKPLHDFIVSTVAMIIKTIPKISSAYTQQRCPMLQSVDFSILLPPIEVNFLSAIPAIFFTLRLAVLAAKSLQTAIYLFNNTHLCSYFNIST